MLCKLLRFNGSQCYIALQELINVCYQYNNEIGLNFNAT